MSKCVISREVFLRFTKINLVRALVHTHSPLLPADFSDPKKVSASSTYTVPRDPMEEPVPIEQYAGIIESEVELQSKLGTGQFGEVWRGVCRRTTVAIKILYKDKLTPVKYQQVSNLLESESNYVGFWKGGRRYEECPSPQCPEASWYSSV
jgi:hypothetical protein